ncbi:hypothetical protein F5Y06DRAFT_25096 [Hypoxylon sp. FL0890]|nr:hypothetical protein F5Y06DRAFT_25096 [Hypoxylon sp. FL0890]
MAFRVTLLVLEPFPTVATSLARVSFSLCPACLGSGRESSALVTQDHIPNSRNAILAACQDCNIVLVTDRTVIGAMKLTYFRGCRTSRKGLTRQASESRLIQID